MKNILNIALLATLLLSPQAYAVKDIVNGGSVVVCRNPERHIKSIELLDYFEARMDGRSVKLSPSLPTWKEKAQEVLQRWQPIAPVRMNMYLGYLDSFTREAAILSGIEIPDIPDRGAIFLPKGCELEQVAFQRAEKEIYPGQKRYLINKDLWDLMDENQKAGLVLHELIYREGISFHHPTSAPTRYMNGILASEKPEVMPYIKMIILMPFARFEMAGIQFNTHQHYKCTATACDWYNPTKLHASGFPIRAYGMPLLNTPIRLKNASCDNADDDQDYWEFAADGTSLMGSLRCYQNLKLALPMKNSGTLSISADQAWVTWDITDQTSKIEINNNDVKPKNLSVRQSSEYLDLNYDVRADVNWDLDLKTVDLPLLPKTSLLYSDVVNLLKDSTIRFSNGQVIQGISRIVWRDPNNGNFRAPEIFATSGRWIFKGDKWVKN